MSIWFMHDNHTFTKVGELHDTDREAMVLKAHRLFLEDHCGTLFAKSDHVQPLRTELHGKIFKGATLAQINGFFDSLDEEVNWIARG